MKCLRLQESGNTVYGGHSRCLDFHTQRVQILPIGCYVRNLSWVVFMMQFQRNILCLSICIKPSSVFEWSFVSKELLMNLTALLLIELSWVVSFRYPIKVGFLNKFLDVCIYTVHGCNFCQFLRSNYALGSVKHASLGELSCLRICRKVWSPQTVSCVQVHADHL